MSCHSLMPRNSTAISRSTSPGRGGRAAAAAAARLDGLPAALQDAERDDGGQLAGIAGIGWHRRGRPRLSVKAPTASRPLKRDVEPVGGGVVLGDGNEHELAAVGGNAARGWQPPSPPASASTAAGVISFLSACSLTGVSACSRSRPFHTLVQAASSLRRRAPRSRHTGTTMSGGRLLVRERDALAAQQVAHGLRLEGEVEAGDVVGGGVALRAHPDAVDQVAGLDAGEPLDAGDRP